MSSKEKDLENLLRKKEFQLSKKGKTPVKQETKNFFKELDKEKLERFLEKKLEKEEPEPQKNKIKLFEKTKKLKEVVLSKEESFNIKTNFSFDKQKEIYENSKEGKFYGIKSEVNPLSQKKEEENIYENNSSMERLTYQRQKFIQDKKKPNFYSENEGNLLEDYSFSSEEETTKIKFAFEAEKKKKLYKEFNL